METGTHPYVAPAVSAPYRVLVTGSRGWPHRRAVEDALAALERLVTGRLLVLVHGGCPGSPDQQADSWVRSRMAVPPWLEPEVHRASWERHGVRAGFVRNAEMVALGADVCLAFVGPCRSPRCRDSREHDSHGAAHCADLAERAGITTVRFRLTDLQRSLSALPARLR